MKSGKSSGGAKTESGDAEIVRRMLAEEKLDAARVLAALIGALVRDHVAVKEKAGSTALNYPTTLWTVEKAVWEAGNVGPGVPKPDVRGDAQLLRMLSVLLVTCRERAEDEAAATKKEQRPTMRLVRD